MRAVDEDGQAQVLIEEVGPGIAAGRSASVPDEGSRSRYVLESRQPPPLQSGPAEVREPLEVLARDSRPWARPIPMPQQASSAMASRGGGRGAGGRAGSSSSSGSRNRRLRSLPEPSAPASGPRLCRGSKWQMSRASRATSCKARGSSTQPPEHTRPTLRRFVEQDETTLVGDWAVARPPARSLRAGTRPGSRVFSAACSEAISAMPAESCNSSNRQFGGLRRTG